MPSDRFTLSVPASSANLGPGFDTLGVALERRIRADVEAGGGHDGCRIEFGPGPFAPTHDGLRAEIERGITRVAGTAALRGLHLRVDNGIPLGKGLGGSAAGAVLGVAIGALRARERPSSATLAQIITEIEGHPDNGIPALLGGFVVAAQRADGVPSYIRFPAPHGLRAVVVVPDIEMPTAAARAILPAMYSRRDAVFNIQHAALLGAALASERLDLLREAMDDRLHQPYRAGFVPGLSEMLAFDDEHIVGIALSGAGPSVIAFVREDGGNVKNRMQATFAAHGVESTALELAFATRGVIVESPLEESWPT